MESQVFVYRHAICPRERIDIVVCDLDSDVEEPLPFRLNIPSEPRRAPVDCSSIVVCLGNWQNLFGRMDALRRVDGMSRKDLEDTLPVLSAPRNRHPMDCSPGSVPAQGPNGGLPLRLRPSAPKVTAEEVGCAMMGSGTSCPIASRLPAGAWRALVAAARDLVVALQFRAFARARPVLHEHETPFRVSRARW